MALENPTVGFCKSVVGEPSKEHICSGTTDQFVERHINVKYKTRVTLEIFVEVS